MVVLGIRCMAEAVPEAVHAGMMGACALHASSCAQGPTAVALAAMPLPPPLTPTVAIVEVQIKCRSCVCEAGRKALGLLLQQLLLGR